MPEKINEKELIFKNANDLLQGRQWVINTFEYRIFPTKGVNISSDDDHT